MFINFFSSKFFFSFIYIIVIFSNSKGNLKKNDDNSIPVKEVSRYDEILQRLEYWKRDEIETNVDHLLEVYFLLKILFPIFLKKKNLNSICILKLKFTFFFKKKKKAKN